MARKYKNKKSQYRFISLADIAFIMLFAIIFFNKHRSDLLNGTQSLNNSKSKVILKLITNDIADLKITNKQLNEFYKLSTKSHSPSQLNHVHYDSIHHFITKLTEYAEIHNHSIDIIITSDPDFLFNDVFKFYNKCLINHSFEINTSSKSILNIYLGFKKIK